MAPGAVLLFYIASIIGASMSPTLAYWLMGRGVATLRALRIATVTGAALLLVVIAPLMLFIVGLAGAAGWLGVAVVGAVFLAQYMIAPRLVLRGLRLRSPGPGEEWLMESLGRLLRAARYNGRINLYIADDNVPNAFAVSSPLEKTIVVNSGLLRILDRDEAEAVIAHEVGHIVHHDNGYMIATSFAPTAVYLLGVSAIIGGALMIRAASAVASAAEEAWDSRASASIGLTALAGFLGGLALILVGAVLAAASFVATLAVLGFSRTREHLADTFSVRLTRSDAVASALRKIESTVKLSGSNSRKGGGFTPRLRSTLYIIPMIYAAGYRALFGFHPEPLRWLAPLSSHPPLDARVYIVERAYREVVGLGGQAAGSA